MGVNSPNYPVLGQGVLPSARALELPLHLLVPWYLQSPGARRILAKKHPTERGSPRGKSCHCSHRWPKGKKME